MVRILLKTLCVLGKWLGPSVSPNLWLLYKGHMYLLYTVS